MTLHGASPTVVRRSIAEGDPLPGTSGFAGFVDGVLVRDVLGREPMFVERGALQLEDASTWKSDSSRWSQDPTALTDPIALPAGSVSHRPGQCERRWCLPEVGYQADETAIIDELDRAIDIAVSTTPTAAAVAFSGGVDSALLAASFEGPLVSVGFPDSHDLDVARDSAATMNRDLLVCELDHDQLRSAIPVVANATGRTNAMDVSIGLVAYFAAETAAEAGHDAIAFGFGADELFGGYEKIAALDHRVEASSVRGAVREQIETVPTQIERDVLATRAAGIEPIAPLLHDAVVEVALRLPEELLVDGERRKVALRSVAATRIDQAIADRPKKAAQYGTGIARELDRLARQAGFKRRLDDHVSRYVCSRLDSDVER